MPTWGPVSVSVGPGSVTPDTRFALLFDTGFFALGEITQITGTGNASFTGGRSDAVYKIFINAYADNGDQIEVRVPVDQRLTTATYFFSYPVPFGARHVTVRFQGNLYAGQTMSSTANGDFSTSVHCVYGTQTKTGGPQTLILTPANILSALEVFGVGILAVAFQRIIGLAIDVTGICRLPPGQLPAVNSDLLTWSPSELLEMMQVLMWFQFCECVPGSPAPVPFPEPTVPIPASWPAVPTFPCDPADLCAAISDIRTQIAGIQTATAQTLGLVTLLQRYRLPFAYIPGATHAGLSDAGGFAVSRLAGVQVVITESDPARPILPGNPGYRFDMGWLSVVDDNGMFEEKRLTRDLQLWFPVAMPVASHFQWALTPGTVITVTELEAEP